MHEGVRAFTPTGCPTSWTIYRSRFPSTVLDVTPNDGDVRFDIGKAVADIKAGKDYLAVIEEILRAKPEAVKGKYVKGPDHLDHDESRFPDRRRASQKTQKGQWSPRSSYGSGKTKGPPGSHPTLTHIAGRPASPREIVYSSLREG